MDVALANSTPDNLTVYVKDGSDLPFDLGLRVVQKIDELEHCPVGESEISELVEREPAVRYQVDEDTGRYNLIYPSPHKTP